MGNGTNERDNWEVWWPRIVSILGVAGVYHEMIIANFDRPWLLAALMGLSGYAPAVGLDRWLKERNGG